MEERLYEARSLMGADDRSGGLEANRATLAAFVRRHHRRGLSREPAPEERFDPATRETFRA